MSLRAICDVSAPAKLNLFLHVVGRRADGYHLLQSAMVLIDWQDTLHFERRDDGRLQRHDLEAVLPDDDLCLRAARLLQAESGTTLGADISIAKRVPWGAGLGGGSSDAASTLLALNRLWGLHWPRPRLERVALALGADVPFFVHGHNAFVEGIGERIKPINVPRRRFAIIKPEVALQTAAIFSSPLLVRDTGADILESFIDDRLAPVDCSVPAYGRNDLQAPAEASSAEVGQAAALLFGCFGNSRMTGSGSAVFARADSEDGGTVIGRAQGGKAQCRSGIFPDLPRGWTGRMCRSLEAHPLVGWAED